MNRNGTMAGSGDDGDWDHPRVVMLLANEFLHDTRVYKEARSLIEWGCEVHIVALARNDLPMEEVQNGICVHRVEIRRGLLWRLAVALPMWWCLPAVRRLLPDRPVRQHRHLAGSPVSDGRTGGAPAVEAPGMRGSMSRSLRTVLRGLRFLFGSPAATGCVRLIRSLPRRFRRLVKRLAKRPRVPQSFRLLAFNVQCVGQARMLRPDVVHCHDLNTLLAGALLRRIGGSPLLYDSHELFLERNLGERRRGLDRAVWGPIERGCIRRCDAVISVAEGICRHLAEQYRIPKPHLIRNVQPYEPPAPKSRLLRDELGIPPEKAIVLYPGAITINRGLEVLIDSARHLENAVYVIMGYARNSAYIESLRERARRQGQLDRTVYFREAVPIDQVVRYTASADLGIVPTQNVCLSYYYESSNKIFHCLMAGVPVAMSDHAEKRLLVEEYGIGVLFDETDATEIARVVQKALDEREEYGRMRRRCLEAARSLNWEHEERKLRTIYADLLGDRAQRVRGCSSAALLPEIEVAAGAELDAGEKRAEARVR